MKVLIIGDPITSQFISAYFYKQKNCEIHKTHKRSDIGKIQLANIDIVIVCEIKVADLSDSEAEYLRENFNIAWDWYTGIIIVDEILKKEPGLKNKIIFYVESGKTNALEKIKNETIVGVCTANWSNLFEKLENIGQNHKKTKNR